MERQSILDAYAQSLARETHVLQDNPALLWQQLYNRLQWAGEGVTGTIAAELQQRSQLGTVPWIRTKIPYPESEALLRTLSDHTNQVLACDISPDGLRMVSAGKDETLRIWDLDSGRIILEWTSGVILDCHFSPDGGRILTAGENKTLLLWQATTGQLLREFGPHYWQVKACSFSPDGSQVLSACNNDLKLFDITSGEQILELGDENAYENGYKNCVFSPGGNLIAAVAGDKKLRVWDTKSNELVLIFEDFERWSYDCAFSPDGKQIAIAHDKEPVILAMTNGEIRHTLTGHSKTVNACAFSPDGNLLVTAGADYTLRLWDAVTGDHLNTYEGHTGEVQDCVFSPDGQVILSAGADRTLRLWDLNAPQTTSSNQKHTKKVTGLAFSPDGDSLLSASEETVLRVWDTQTHRTDHTLKGSIYGLNDCDWGADGRLLAAVSNQTLFIWDLDTGEEKTIKKYDKGWFQACRVSPDGNWVLTATTSKALYLYHADSGKKERDYYGHMREVYACAFSPDGHTIVSGEKYRDLILWEAATGQRLKLLRGHTGEIRAVAFSPAGDTIVSGSADETARVWDAATGTHRYTLSGVVFRQEQFQHTPHQYNHMTACCFSPDGQFILTVGLDRVLRVWRSADGTLSAQLPLPGALTALDVHPWRPWVVCGDESGVVYPLEMVGLQYDPIILTARTTGNGILCRCPACQHDHPLQPDQLGQELTCPTPGCSLSLKLNPFLMKTDGYFTPAKPLKADPKRLGQAEKSKQRNWLSRFKKR